MRRNRSIAVVAGFFALATLTQCFTEKQNQGQRLYTANCASCHMEDGTGLRGVIPPLAQSDYIQKHRTQLPCLVRHGINRPIVVNGQEYNQEMPGVEALRADEMTNLLNYIQTNFGNSNERYTMQQVAELLDRCPSH
ncbi:c-type cytochrome [Pontibacter silvestris]|uniref:C-type cytochrome n=1 Tax=Pontibacter silvestris TaxID=2305183 RepID=A0ABW4WUX5_9BACT|nr:cytochrome c [Pontibacter silvestris]MCC9136887.1 cytochrome c [Pontibacter silvestris]